MVFPVGHYSRNCNKPMDEGSVHGYGDSDNPSFGGGGFGDPSSGGGFEASAAPSWDNPSSGGGGFGDPSSGGGFEVSAAPSWETGKKSGGGFDAPVTPSWETGKKSNFDHVPGVFPDRAVEAPPSAGFGW